MPPAAATIFFGANDAALLGRNSEKQHVPIGEYKDNLRRIVYHLKVQSCFTRYFEIFCYAHSLFICILKVMVRLLSAVYMLWSLDMRYS